MEPALPPGAHAEVCIIGAGMAGLSIAYWLGCHGASVMVLDRGPIGGGETSRTTAHLASATDSAEAAACGEAAVRAAVQGQSGCMVKIVRLQNNPYKWTTGLHPLTNITNGEHLIPRDWFSEDGFVPNEKFVEYARPLIEGEVKYPIEGGLLSTWRWKKCGSRRNCRRGNGPNHSPIEFTNKLAWRGDHGNRNIASL